MADHSTISRSRSRRGKLGRDMLVISWLIATVTSGRSHWDFIRPTVSFSSVQSRWNTQRKRPIQVCNYNGSYKEVVEDQWNSNTTAKMAYENNISNEDELKLSLLKLPAPIIFSVARPCAQFPPFQRLQGLYLCDARCSLFMRTQPFLRLLRLPSRLS